MGLESEALGAEINRLQSAVQVLTDKMVSVNITMAEWAGKYELHQHRMGVIEEKLEDAKVGSNKDRDENREWRKETFYPFKKKAEDDMATLASAVKTALDYKRLMLILLAAGFIGALMGDGLKLVMRLLNAAVGG